jgi:hypothetical protein
LEDLQRTISDAKDKRKIQEKLSALMSQIQESLASNRGEKSSVPYTVEENQVNAQIQKNRKRIETRKSVYLSAEIAQLHDPNTVARLR